MPSLQQAVDAMLREIDAALAGDRPLPNGTCLEADRIILTLQVQIVPDGDDKIPRIHVVSSPSGDSTATLHSITFELRRFPAAATETDVGSPHVRAVSRPTQELTGADAAAALAQLSEILGAPGFDSAARASVLCEAWSELTHEQAVASVDALLDVASASNSPAVARARHLLAGIVKSGPSQSLSRGTEVLGTQLRKHSVVALTAFVRREWKSQDAWMG